MQSDTAQPSTRLAGALMLATAAASVLLLTQHPGGQAQTFAQVLQEEAANRTMDAVVHGGFIVVLVLQIAGYAVFSARLGLKNLAALIGLVFFCAGAAFMAGSLLVDGLVLPTLAARYAAVPAKIEAARTLFVLCGALLQFLMPIGLLFQSAAVLSWSAALLQNGRRAAGMAGLVLGALAAAALAAAAMGQSMLMMGTMLALALWAALVGVLLLRRAA